jgi:hypothetical protein
MVRRQKPRTYRDAVTGRASLGLIGLPLSPERQFDCAEAYKGFWGQLEDRCAELSPQCLVALTRHALRLYEASQTRDLRDADVKALFESRHSRMGRRHGTTSRASAS